MTLVEIMPAIRELHPTEKLHLIRILAEELDALAQDNAGLVPDASYPVYTPLDSYDAATAVMAELEGAHGQNAQQAGA